MSALTYQQIYTAVLGSRFPSSSQLANAKRWVDTAYQDVWGADDWTFRRVPRATLAISATDQPPMPPDFAEAIELYDDKGNRLERYAEERFERYFTNATVTTGIPVAYMVVNRQIYLSSSVSANFLLSYRRRLSHKDSGGSVVSGPMSNDSDKPLWDDHHSILIPRAQAIGLQEINDPTWQGPQAEYERQLDRMKKDYEQINPAYQWGAVSWYV